ncbi:diaminopimelate decarboxylase [Ligilactobacillus saerimneri]|uniref:Diaminopimelate decarboxylase n=2 Tax=Ligilactobacillus saerimneri TaxID=228229 RepID=M5J6I1_9LACO|nr:diaminopimelate decarboxylase [Ligilactobacillus saerimneri]EKW98767.1 diaminopimelate decarboxylase [Ligilactobacillus saerimneri 30a]KRL74853.1 Diaminopimelate decarboxylase [Ligilactobacillus saerimneri DSM 16049]MCZ0891510.1 diaminopimelate decarboxylase [Ligilactobacillus saerimneri]QLL77669.1 diaminopimelate decarboxylase [Ligilactobacillus saerimneri]HJF30043.1 diaminopimelate decarboxylase [Ligilactobacillus saerimneri]
MTNRLDLVDTNAAGHIAIGGVDALKLTQQYGTPLIAYDTGAIRRQIRSFQRVFEDLNIAHRVVYASKAFSSLAMYQLAAESNIGCDVVSGGELYAALKGGMRPEMIEFHGNNKLPHELEYAVDAQIGCIVVDNFQELHTLQAILADRQQTMRVMLRVAPGILAETHEYISTGQEKSKFGFDIRSGQAARALQEMLADDHLDVIGVHCHIGSQIFDVQGFIGAAKKMALLLRDWNQEFGFDAQVLNLGGGFGIKYTGEDDPLPAEEFVKTIIEVVEYKVNKYHLQMPAIWVEPGRALVGDAATTLYTIGSSKHVAGVCDYISVDGGMGDNIRPALYHAKYEALLADRPHAENTQVATVVGKYCESGDILVEDCPLPPTHPGDVLAVPATGAYGYTMASNYNRNPRPAVVFCENGESRLVIRRETYADMLRCEVGIAQ